MYEIERGRIMKFIQKIEIQYFRSIYNQTMREIKDLNVFTGKNDVGKSNTLKALNLFFNNQTDANMPFVFEENYNFKRKEEVRKDSIKGRQFIQIKITFIRGAQSEKTLPEIFTVTKTWYRNDIMPSVIADDVERQMIKCGKKYNDRSKSSLTTFLNKIKFIYVPAIKDDATFQFVMNQLQDTIYNDKLAESGDLKDSLGKLSTVVSLSANEINIEFQKVTGISTSITTPKTITDLYKTLAVSTEFGANTVDLSKRGDGIRVRYIPSILNHIASTSKKNYIWGFEEPENSLEYNLALEMSNSFKDVYSKHSMIFITSHSPAFIGLHSSETVQCYRCFSEDNSTKIILMKDAKKYKSIEEELGYVKIQQEIYEKYMESITLNKKLEENNKSLNKQIQNYEKPIVLTEGKTDVAILTVAWKKLYGELECPFIIKSCNINQEDENSAAGCDMLATYLKSYRFDAKCIVIGLFDRDIAGNKATN